MTAPSPKTAAAAQAGEPLDRAPQGLVTTPSPKTAAAPEERPAGRARHARRSLAQRLRASRALSAAQKRYWLAVLPHLRAADRERLDAILRGETG